MGEAKRTTKLELDFRPRKEGGMNTGKRENLFATEEILNRSREFYLRFFLAQREKLKEKVKYFSEKHKEYRERLISADELLTWAEFCTVATPSHKKPMAEWNFSKQFSDMPIVYRRSVIKDAIGKVRSYLSNYKNWEESGKKKGKPGVPGAANHPTLYQGSVKLSLQESDLHRLFLRIKVYDGNEWIWQNYPVRFSRWQSMRLREKDWETESPKLVLREQSVTMHIPQIKKISAKKVKESKQNKQLVTIAVDLNVKNLAVATVRQKEKVIATLFFKDKGLDQHRYRHLKKISKKQWQSGNAVKGEHSNIKLWKHIRRTNEDFAHKASKAIATLAMKYPGSVLIFENLRKIRSKGSKTHRLNRKLANQIRGLVRDYSKYKAFQAGTVTVEVNPHGTSQYCSHCGEKGERFSQKDHQPVKAKGGKLFHCPACHYSANADFNASVNLHHSFYRELHWQSSGNKTKSATKDDKSGKAAKEDNKSTKKEIVQHTLKQATFWMIFFAFIFLFISRAHVSQNALPGYIPGGISRLEGHPDESLPCPYANEHTRKVVGLSLAQRGKVPAQIASRARPFSITYSNLEGTGVSRTGKGRREQLCQYFSSFV